jgi:hypothetical protein
LEDILRFNIWLIILIILLAAVYTQAHDGLFVRFSVGLGYYGELSQLDESGFVTPAKNHALGWGFKQKYAVQISDFGGLISNHVGEYDYINLDALGLGFTYYLPDNISATFSVGQGKVTFAKNWWEITDDGEETGYALNLSVDKEWIIAKHWGLGLGAHGFYFKTNDIDYEFLQFGINAAINFYFSSVQ